MTPADGDQAGAATAKPAFKPLPMKAPSVSVQRRADGSILIWSNHAPGAAPRSRRPTTLGPVTAKTTPANITTKPNTDSTGKPAIMVALNATPATSMARPSTNSPAP